MRKWLIISLVAVAAALSGAAWWACDSRDAALQAAAERRVAVRAAVAYAVNLLSLNHRTIDEDIGRVLASSTGPEREEYAREAPALKAAVLKHKTVQTGVLRASAVESADATTAHVLIVADAVMHWEDGGNTPPEGRYYRWRMTVSKVAGRWLVSDSELVQ